ncbi:MAG: hypothetical protein SF029_02050 [bacterium]|nr:hypothetical protein [bacterium]
MGKTVLCCWLLVGAVVLVACGAQPQPQPTTAPNISPVEPTGTRLPTIVPPSVRATLPPSYTPTASITPTAIPSLTPTPTNTTTPSAAEVCDAVEPAIIDNQGEIILFILETNRSDVGLNIELVNQNNDESLEFQVPGAQQNIAPLPANQLPGAGVYRWTVTAFTETQRGLCEQTGEFEIRVRPPLAPLLDALISSGIGAPPSPTPIPTRTATPEVIPEATAEATPDSP